MEFSDQDLRLVMNRALRSVLVAIAVGIPIIWFAWGWRSAVLYVVGGAIAATGILEWRQLMTAVLVRIPVADAADATGVIVTVNQLGLVIGVATFGTLYLNLAGSLPAHTAGQAGGGGSAHPAGASSAVHAFGLLSAHAVSVTCVVLAGAGVAGGALAAFRARNALDTRVKRN